MKKLNKKAFLLTGLAVASVAVVSTAIACSDNTDPKKANEEAVTKVNTGLRTKYNLAATYTDTAALKKALDDLKADGGSLLKPLNALLSTKYGKELTDLVGDVVVEKVTTTVPSGSTTSVSVVLTLSKGKSGESSYVSKASKAITLYTTPQGFLNSVTLPTAGYTAASTVANRDDLKKKVGEITAADKFAGLSALLDSKTPINAKVLELEPETTLTTIATADESDVKKTKLTLTFKQGELTTNKEVVVTTKA
ncbi:hypothetical protein CJJ23_04765 [Mycoplasmopsis agassizii]|uniref:Lipoprotein n=1 Tax=Mycoplasmopsis agassizii TaxID=33922 RepID=A0A269THP1_9BACT|nr:hypothetical protein [Mycoplasmopsis agassizii]PAK20911.1 hypothetical protein CJJ23_04765 [Mycoplasmopsis agassizii]